MRKFFYVVVAALALALPVNAFAATIAIKINPAAFAPKTVTINDGDTVKWTNADTVNRQLVADSGAFASPILKPGQAYSFTFKTPGTYGYHDALKPTVKGTITVKGPPPSLTLGAGNPILVYGAETSITGTVSSGAANEPVVITSRPYGSATVQQVSTVMTGQGGGFSVTVKPDILTTYSAKWKTATSQDVSVQVRPKLSLLPYAGRFRASVTAPVSYAGHTILLQRLSSFGQWITVAQYKLGQASGKIFSMPRKKGTFKYRVYLSVNQAGPGYLDAWSGTQKITRKKA
jgi:plastocyanin